MRFVLVLSAGLLVTCASARRPVADLSECVQPWEPAAQTLPDGRELFLHEWSASDPRSALGDGLGPLFNGRSCVECHDRGGVGGAGGEAANVELLSGFGVFHKSSTLPGWRVPQRTSLGVLGSSHRGFLGLGLKTHRATPALFGAGRLDRVTEEDLLVAEALSGRHHIRVSGRVGRDAEGRPGRFGWKGQTADLATFVEGACANELGLQTPAQDQPRHPQQPRSYRPGIDLEPADVEALVDFVAALPAPRFVPTGAALRGRVAFDEIGCTACHTEDIGEVEGAYTDLLLHDMGFALSDAGLSTYGGLRRQVARPEDATPAEWRTPPLWGVADSGPWLHDGRATTLDDAVRLHGGEALDIRRAYETLPEEDRADVISFLEALVAPNVTGPVAVHSVADPVTFHP